MRLIDADELMEHVWRDKLDSRELIAKMIDNVPPVKEIPIKIPIDVFEQLISQETVINKIRAEIEALPTAHTVFGYDSAGELWTVKLISSDSVLEILDKYNAESEDERK